jgi:hypothetical protein
MSTDEKSLVKHSISNVLAKYYFIYSIKPVPNMDVFTHYNVSRCIHTGDKFYEIEEVLKIELQDFGVMQRCAFEEGN